VGVACLIGIAEEDHGPILWTLTMGLLLISRLWVRRQLTPASVGCFFLAVHLTIGCLMTCWTFGNRRDEWPAAAMHPAFLTIIALDNSFEREFRDMDWVSVYASYWLALAVNLVWARWWLIRNFERLVERTGARPAPRAAPTRRGPDPFSRDAERSADSIPREIPAALTSGARLDESP
jgi:hypothetical protein